MTPRQALSKLKLGTFVVVTWLDSGAGATGRPGRDRANLIFKTTCGKVTKVSKTEEIHKLLCQRGKHCRCYQAELAMCSYGEDDTRSDLSGIWVDAITDVKIMPTS